MAYNKAITWVDSLQHTIEKPFGHEYISMCIKFMTSDVVNQPDDESILKNKENKKEYTNCMKVLIVILLNKTQLDDDSSMVERLRNQVKTSRPSFKTIIEIDRHIIQVCLNKLISFTKNKSIEDIFNVLILSDPVIANKIAVFSMMYFKRKIFECLPSKNDNVYIEGFNKYFLSLAVCNKSAADIYGPNKNPLMAIEKCTFCPLGDPNFSLEQFLSTGPPALFYGHIEMMYEMRFVTENRGNLGNYSLFWYLKNNWSYSPDGEYIDEWIGHRRRKTMYAYFVKIHGFNKIGSLTFKKINNILGSNIGIPYYAFARPL